MDFLAYKKRLFIIFSTKFLTAVLFAVFSTSSFGFSVDEYQKGYEGTGAAWENNHLGIGDEVPEPWVPVSKTDGKISCWGRDFYFSDGLLFDQIVSQKIQLFESPPKLFIKIDGQTVDDRGIRWKVMEEGMQGITMSAAVLVSSYTRIDMRARVEFDGFVRFDLKFSSTKEAALESLKIGLPIADSIAEKYSKFLDYDFARQSIDYESLKNSAGYITGTLSFPFSPTFWIGNEEIGFEWVCDTNIHWEPGNIDEAIQIKKTGSGSSFIANIVGKNVVFNGNLLYTFGFYATPVKKPVSDWRRYFFTADAKTAKLLEFPEKHNINAVIFPWPERECPLRIHGLPEPYPSGVERAKYLKSRKELSENNVGYIPYTKLYILSENSEIPKKYWNRWKTGTGRRWPGTGYMGGTQDIRVTLENKSIQDFYIYKICEAIKKYKINGVYIDVSTPGSNFKGHTGKVGRIDRFLREKVNIPLLAHREYMKRLYIAAKALDKNFLIIPHCGKITQVNGAFSDFIVSGESINRIFMEKGEVEKVKLPDGRVVYKNPDNYIPDYFDLPEEIFPGIDYGQKNGYINIILPQIEKRNKEFLRRHPEKEIQWTRSLLGYTLSYDLLVWSKRLHLKTYLAVVNAVDNFMNIDHSVEYFSPNITKNLFDSGSNGEISISAYKTGKKAVIVVVNRSPVKSYDEITIPENWILPGKRIDAVFDGETNSPVDHVRNKIKTAVKGKDFLLLFVNWV